MKLTVEIRSSPGKFRELYQTLEALLPTIRKEKGCRECRIYRDVEDDEIFFMSIQWKAKASLEHYMRSTNGVALLGAIKLLTESAVVRIGRDAPLVKIAALNKMTDKPLYL